MKKWSIIKKWHFINDSYLLRVEHLVIFNMKVRPTYGYATPCFRLDKPDLIPAVWETFVEHKMNEAYISTHDVVEWL